MALTRSSVVTKVGEKYDQLTRTVPELWGYPLFCGIMRVVFTDAQRAPFQVGEARTAAESGRRTPAKLV
ncbi:hypothetical protein [Pseudonocardia halophobica]|uniref:hypothetical protein n=1 Tax=Pseudonocardia halophobica TaxID=29401 RepID=UPI00056D4994|nr:hypothetical protein [Pseudonocardia halophobica]